MATRQIQPTKKNPSTRDCAPLTTAIPRHVSGTDRRHAYFMTTPQRSRRHTGLPPMPEKGPLTRMLRYDTISINRRAGHLYWSRSRLLWACTYNSPSVLLFRDPDDKGERR